MVVAGYSLAVLMGLTLGIIGGGGSILTVPILVYLLGVSPVKATAYSLLVVGLTALVGAWRYHLQSLINVKVGLYFAVPSVLGVWLARAYLLPILPAELITTPGLTLTKDAFVMILFSALMLLVAYFMLRPRPNPTNAASGLNYWLIGAEGFGVGVFTGIVGAGGGFLIVPALVLLARLPMKEAVATSLAIIAAKSLIGFTGDLQAGFRPDILLTVIFTGLTIFGMLAGVRVTRFASDAHIKKAFALLVLVLGAAILTDQILTILNT